MENRRSSSRAERGLVEEEEPGIPAKGPCKSGPLLLSAGELSRKVSGDVRQSREIEKLLRPLSITRCVEAHPLDRHVRKKGVILEDEADGTTLRREEETRRGAVPGFLPEPNATGNRDDRAR